MIDRVDVVARPLVVIAAGVIAVCALAIGAGGMRWLRRRLQWSTAHRRIDHVAQATLAVGAMTGIIIDDSSRVASADSSAPGSPDSPGTRRPTELPLLASAAMAAGSIDVFRRRRRDAMRALLGGQVPDTPAPDVVALRRLLLARARHFDAHRAEHERHRLLPVGMNGAELVSIPLTRGRRVIIGHRDEATTRAVLRHLANVVATAPWLDDVRVVAHGLEPHDVVDSERVDFARSSDDMWRHANELAERNPDLTVVVVDVSGDSGEGRHEPNVVVLSPAAEEPPKGDVDTDVLRHGEQGWRFDSYSRAFVPFAASVDDVAMVRRGTEPERAIQLRATPLRHEWSVMVQLLGPLQAVDRAGAPLTFEKSKSLEFLAWLCMHPDRPTVIGARTALWDGSVRDSTFNNVVSDLRRALYMVTEDDARWPRRLSTNRYELGPHVVTDVDLLLDAIAAAEHATSRDTVRLICDRLANVRGMPFEGMASDWADCEGITSNIVMIVVAAASLAARLALTLDDDESVLLATSHGLRMLPGHEELVSLRLLVHERRGEHGAGRMYRAEKESTSRVR